MNEQQIKQIIRNEIINILGASSKIPLAIDQSFRERFLGGLVSTSSLLTVPYGGTGAATLTGILKGNGTGAITAITPLAGAHTYYVAISSGGAVTTPIEITNGVQTS